MSTKEKRDVFARIIIYDRPTKPKKNETLAGESRIGDCQRVGDRLPLTHLHYYAVVWRHSIVAMPKRLPAWLVGTVAGRKYVRPGFRGISLQ